MTEKVNDGFEMEKEVKQPKESENNDTRIEIKGKDEVQERNKFESVLSMRSLIQRVRPENENTRKFMLNFCIHVAVLAYVIASVLRWNDKGRPALKFSEGLGLFLCILIVVYVTLFYFKIVKPIFQSKRLKSLRKANSMPSWFPRWIQISFYTVPPILFAIFLIIDTSDDRSRLTGLLGVAAIYFLGFLFSKHPSQIRWDIIYRGSLIQILMAMCTVRWEPGRIFFSAVGNKVEQLLSYSYVGAAFVYSDNLIYNQTVFAFQCLSVIYFVNFIVEVLFYYQILQRLFSNLGSFLQKAIGTTPIESINCCVSLFLGMSEAMLVIKLYVKDLTMSELQAVFLGQLSTVAGSVFAAYASFGVKPGYLVSASVMSAPAALTLSKLLYPETEISKTASESLQMDTSHKDKFSSALSAGCHGALSAVNIVSGVVASLITFISLIAFANGIVSFLAELIGFENVTLITLLAKCFIPVAFLIGIEPSQCHLVGELIATKAIVNEFVAYQKLGEFQKQSLLSKKSEAIATYALCSFANPSSVASVIAMVSALCPEKMEATTKLAFRAYVGGIVTCLISASLAGLLTPTNMADIMNMVPATNTSHT